MTGISCAPATAPVEPIGPVTVLGGEGASYFDRLVERVTPGCFVPESEHELRAWIDRARTTYEQRLGLDARITVRSAIVQRRIERDDHRIDVVRLEVHPGQYLPTNVYVPGGDAGERSAPLVITPTGCGSGTGTPDVQTRASGLAARGFFVLVTEGFCNNGARADTADGDPRVGYARQLLGLPGEITVYLQELLAARRWAPTAYPRIDPSRIGAAGYSYGGQMALYLAQFDPGIASVSVPATAVGRPCSDRRLPSDLWLESSPDHGETFIWSAPLEIETAPANWRLAMTFPRALHTTSGSRDWGAHPDAIGPAMRYASDLYALAGLESRVLYKTDGGRHHYGRSRRTDTFDWFERTLGIRREATAARRERAALAPDSLRVDLSGTRTLADELHDLLRRERIRRFEEDGEPRGDLAARLGASVRELDLDRFGSGMTLEMTWRREIGGFGVTGYRLSHGSVAVPLIEIEGRLDAAGPDLLYLPSRGVSHELGRLFELARRHRRVYAVDYPGIGELKSDRLLLHTVARYLMHDRESLPERNLALLREIVRTLPVDRIELLACNWATSFYALVLGHLDHGRIGGIRIFGVPEDELGQIGSLEPVPDLLLMHGLFSKLTARELAIGLGAEVVGDSSGDCSTVSPYSPEGDETQ